MNTQHVTNKTADIWALESDLGYSSVLPVLKILDVRKVGVIFLDLIMSHILAMTPMYTTHKLPDMRTLRLTSEWSWTLMFL
jgi:hypothetical protein